MAILIKPVKRINPLKPDEAPKWYLTQVTSVQVDETQMAMEVADETTLNPSEAMMALRQFRKILLRHLQASESVKFGNWGSFSVTLSSTPSDTREGLSTRNIKSVNLNFQPDDAFKNDLQKSKFAWLEKMLGVSPDAPATPDDGDNPDEEDPGTGGENPGTGGENPGTGGNPGGSGDDEFMG